MRKPLTLWSMLLLLTACATSHPSLDEEDDEASVTECDSPGEDRCVVLGCEEGLCGFFGCEDILTEGPSVEPAMAIRPGFPVGPPRPARWWRRAPWLRGGAEPVMTFRWYPERPAPPPPRALPTGAMEKHHLFPQAIDLRHWFVSRNINIHDYTMPIPVHLHRRIHGPGGNGGMWNEAWRQFFKARGPEVQREEIFRHVGVLIYRFELTGPVIPYHRQFR